jgi:pyruvate/2-oxoglutarate dehydrogenase complex dihydrolipoamide dehydrogenase (E3) component
VEYCLSLRDHSSSQRIQRLNGIYDTNLKNDKVEYIQGFASFVNSNTLSIKPADKESRSFEVQGKHILIASGSHSIIPKVPGAELGITSNGFFDLEHQPKRVAVVGTGYISIELSGVFHALGSNVTVFSRSKQILRKFDSVIKDNLLAQMQAVGIKFVFDSSVKGLKKLDAGVVVQYEAEGNQGELEADTVLWAIGRGANVDGMNLEAAGVKMDDKQQIVVDDYQNTNVEGIYALGDVIGKAQLFIKLQLQLHANFRIGYLEDRNSRNLSLITLIFLASFLHIPHVVQSVIPKTRQKKSLMMLRSITPNSPICTLVSLMKKNLQPTN